MPQVPMPLGVTGSEQLPRTRRSLTNLFNNQIGQVIPRPGITELTDTGLNARGQLVFNGSLYLIAGTSLLKVTNLETGATSTIGTIEGNANVETAIGFVEAVIVVKGGKLYTLDKSDVLVDISANANFVPSVAVAFINGRFVYIPADGDPAFFSDIGAAGTVQALSFFDAEELPDLNNTVFNYRNTLYIGGTDSFELFQDTGATPNPFTRLSGRRVLNGFIGGLIEYNNTFVFIGREIEQGFGIYELREGIAVQISNEFIDEILNRLTETQLSEAVGARIKWRGYDLAVFTLLGASFGFYRGQWFLLQSLTDLGVDTIWGGKFITQIGGLYFTSSGTKFGKFEMVNEDYGLPISRVIDTAFESPEGEYFTAQEIQIGLSQGFTNAGGTVGLSMTRDNVQYFGEFFRDLGEIGEYAQIMRWNYPGGLGMYEGFVGLRIKTSQNVEFAADTLRIGLR